MMNLTTRRVLYVAYPLLTVSEESAGGAEQMLWTLEREMYAQGISTTVAASDGSRVSGELFSTGDPCTRPDDFERRNLEHQNKTMEFIRSNAGQGRPFDLVHDQSGGFWQCAGEVDAPVLATLHLPRNFCPGQYFENVPANVSFNCVSESQARNFLHLKSMLGVVPNGILLEHFSANLIPANDVRRNGLLWLGRICEEKGAHLALEIAARAGLNINIAGQVYPFTYHQQYFEREIAPRLARMPNAAFISSPPKEQKLQLLRGARAVLITSVVEETSSLVAMEAAACGTPVVAFRRGALPEVVKDGVTGFLVDGVDDAIQALHKIGQHKIGQIESEACIQYAQDNFSSKVMSERYARLYAQLKQCQTEIVSV
ncbi:MAG TPA: glycosyltransferase [Candidatus Solibacter sp.]|nr:glycosyltransferase [Candidatus Solibacter sp.]